MLPWGLCHGDRICQKIRQIITEALRLKGGRLVQPLFSKRRLTWPCPARFLISPRVEALLQARAAPRRPSQPAVETRWVPSPRLLGAVPAPAGILAVLVPCGPWLATSKLCEALLSLPALTLHLSTSACATFLECHPSMGHLAACLAQEGDSSSRVTLAWPTQGPQALSQGTTGSLWAAAGNCSPAILLNLRFALTPPSLPSLNFGLPYSIQHSTNGLVVTISITSCPSCLQPPTPS